MIRHLVILTFFLFTPAISPAASCCGSAAAGPGLILGDDRISFSTSFQRSDLLSESSSRGELLPLIRDRVETTETLQISLSYLVRHNLQLGASLPLSFRATTRDGDYRDHFVGLGDAILQTTWEILPQYLYSEWKPRGFASWQIVLPTGRSVYQAASPTLTDVSGLGHWGTGIALTFYKKWVLLDALLNSEHQYFFERSFSGPNHSVDVGSFWKNQQRVELGLTPPRQPIRLGVAFSRIQFTGKEVTQRQLRSETAGEVYWDPSVLLNYWTSERTIVSASYTDQSLIPEHQNTTLSRSFMISLRTNWPL